MKVTLKDFLKGPKEENRHTNWDSGKVLRDHRKQKFIKGSNENKEHHLHLNLQVLQERTYRITVHGMEGLIHFVSSLRIKKTPESCGYLIIFVYI